VRSGRRRAAAKEAAAPRGGLFARVHAIARQIPRGKVATYGQLARIVGTTPRAAGFAMAAVTEADRVPWHRVVNARGGSSLAGPDAARQRARLAAEGVRFDRAGRIDLQRWGWLPPDERQPATGRRRGSERRPARQRPRITSRSERTPSGVATRAK